MLGNEIILSSNPRGVFLEGTVDGTPKPGTVMQIKAATAAVGGRFTWEAYNQTADGNRGLIAVLNRDYFQAKAATAAYADGDRCSIYIPAPGEELNMLCEDQDAAIAISDRFIVDDGTGLLLATTGTPESEPFIALEALADPAADQLCWTMFTGF